MRPQPSEVALRLPPNEPEAEEALLGCVLVGGVDALESHEVDPDIFYDLRNRAVYTACQDLSRQNIQIDTVTLAAALRDRKLFDSVGGMGRLAELGDKGVPGSIKHYAGMLSTAWHRRRLIAMCTEVVGRVHERSENPAKTVEWLETELWRLTNPSTSKGGRMLREIIHETLQDIQAAHENPSSVCVPTGFGRIDNLIGGLFAGEMTVLAARPSVGKTALLLNILQDISVRRGIPTGLFSLEMRDRQLVMRMLSPGSGISPSDMRRGNLTQPEIASLIKASTPLYTAPVWINDQPSITLPRFRAEARKAIREHKLQVIGIDYIQLMSNETEYGQGREREMAQISNGVKSFAKEHGVATLVLSQLNRNTPPGERPKLSDLRDTGQLEQDADTVAFLWLKDPAIRKKVNCYVAKQRQGNVGDVEMDFSLATTTFTCAPAMEQMGLAPIERL